MKSTAFQSHVAGKDISLPPGYFVYQAFYNLQSGLKVQHQFYKICTKGLQEYYNVHLSQPNLDELPSMTLQSDKLIQLNPTCVMHGEKTSACGSRETCDV